MIGGSGGYGLQPVHKPSEINVGLYKLRKNSYCAAVLKGHGFRAYP